MNIPEIRVSQIKEIRFCDYGINYSLSTSRKEKDKYELFAIVSEEIVRKSDTCNEQNKMLVVRKYVRCDCNKAVMDDILKMIDRVDGISGYATGNGKDDIVINLNATDYADLGYSSYSDKLDDFDRFGGNNGIECICGYDVRELDLCGCVL